MASENNLNFVYMIKEICLMKCNKFYEELDVLAAKGQKILNVHRIFWMFLNKNKSSLETQQTTLLSYIP